MEQLIYIMPRALAIGALISAPMGPIGMLIIQRTLSKGRMPAFVTGLGAALSDLIYCLLAGFGLSFVTDFIEQQQVWLQLAGGVVLAIFAVFLFRKNPTRELKTVDAIQANNYWSDFATGFLLTFSNPLILFFIVGLFARFTILLPDIGFYHYIAMYVGILGGAICWWYGITWLVSRLRHRINVRSLWLINRIVAIILFIMGGFGVTMAVIDLLK
ncbi:MAG: LysE family translocator [Muribaculaceae bacterium]|nr:LysE family translocator [Muribaculaceae bacterium]